MKTMGAALLIVIFPVLLTPPPDRKTVQGHLATCPVCRDEESNPTRCRAAMGIVSRGYRVDASDPPGRPR